SRRISHIITPRSARPTLFPYTTLFRSHSMLQAALIALRLSAKTKKNTPPNHWLRGSEKRLLSLYCGAQSYNCLLHSHPLLLRVDTLHGYYSVFRHRRAASTRSSAAYCSSHHRRKKPSLSAHC